MVSRLPNDMNVSYQAALKDVATWLVNHKSGWFVDEKGEVVSLYHIHHLNILFQALREGKMPGKEGNV